MQRTFCVRLKSYGQQKYWEIHLPYMESLEWKRERCACMFVRTVRFVERNKTEKGVRGGNNGNLMIIGKPQCVL